MSNTVPDGWKVRSVDEVATVFAGGTPSRSKPEYYNGKVPWVKSGEVNTRIIYRTEEFISELAVKESSARWAKKGSVLVAMYGATAGKVARLMIDAALNQAVSAINGREGFAHNGFLLYAIENNTRELLNTVQGSGQPNLSGQLIKSLDFPVPPLPEQQKIAAILSTVDDVIEKTRAQIDKLKDLKTGMMQELLTKGIGHTEFKDSPVGRIPVEWDCVKMNTVAKVNDGAHHTPKYTNSGVPFLRVTDLKNKDILSGNIKYISLSEHVELIKRCKPEKGDILYSKNGTIGITRLIDWDAEFSIFVSLALIKIISKSVLSEYLVLFMDSPIVHAQIKARSKQGTVTNLHLEEMRDFDIPLPDLEEQIRVAKIINALIVKLDITQQKLITLESVKKALMQDLLTGKVRVKIDEKEPAVA